MGTDGALVAVLADKFAEYRHTMPILQTTPAKTRDTPETANLKTDAALFPENAPRRHRRPGRGYLQRHSRPSAAKNS